MVSSSWRTGGLDYVSTLLKQWGVTGDVIAITPDHTYPTKGVIVQGVLRGHEIAAFIAEYEGQFEPIESFVIFDDDDDMAHLHHRLIRTPFECGITEADADRAIAMLTS